MSACQRESASYCLPRAAASEERHALARAQVLSRARRYDSAASKMPFGRDFDDGALGAAQRRQFDALLDAKGGANAPAPAAAADDAARNAAARRAAGESADQGADGDDDGADGADGGDGGASLEQTRRRRAPTQSASRATRRSTSTRSRMRTTTTRPLSAPHAPASGTITRGRRCSPARALRRTACPRGRRPRRSRR